MKNLLSCMVLSLAGLFALGCSDSKSSANTGTAPVTTISVVFVDSFSEKDRLELIASVKATFEALLKDYPGNTTISYIVNIVNSNIVITINGNKFLIHCGTDNECPNLYEAFCLKRFGPNHPDRLKWKNRCKQIEDDCKKRNKD